MAGRSVRARFAFTLGANLFRSLVSFTTGMVLARWMGPAEYGNMAFLLGTFVGLRFFLDMGSSTAFFTFMSQRPRSRRYVLTYYGWLGIQFVAPLLLVGLLFPARWIDTIWRGHHRGLVLLAFVAAFLQNSVWPVMQQLGESQRRTVFVQAVGVAVVALHFAAIVLLWFVGSLGLYAIFGAIAIEYLVASVYADRRLRGLVTAPEEPGDRLVPLFWNYFRYCLPFIPYSAAVFVQEFGDRWLLQRFGGEVQQAFYAVGGQFAAVALLATTSILRIFWKEIAEAHHQQDHARAGRLYRRVTRLLFLVGAAVAGYLIPWSPDLLRRILGPAYVGGAATLAVMFLYPIHQSMGQIGGTVLYATERVGLQVVTGMLTMLSGMVVSYIVLAPRTAVVPGLGLASFGLAVKMVVVQVVSVNAIAYLIARLWRWPFDWAFQPVSLLGCAAMGWAAHALSVVLLGAGRPLPARMAVAGVAYAVLLAAFVGALPWTAGLTRAELAADVRRALHAGRLVYERLAS